MVSEAKLAANRANALLSTGPRTDEGKAVARMNATTHGLRSTVAVVPGEEPEEWEAHRAGVVAALAPFGAVESELAERVALLFWRLRRVATYETAVIAAGMDQAAAFARGEDDGTSPLGLGLDLFGPRTLATATKERDAARSTVESLAGAVGWFRHISELPEDHPIDGVEAFDTLEEAAGSLDDEEDLFDEDEEDDAYERRTARNAVFLTAAGVPKEWHRQPTTWDKWTASGVRAGLKVIAASQGTTTAALVARLDSGTDGLLASERKRLAKLEVEVTEMTAAVAIKERTARLRAVLPSDVELGKATRYEVHLNKQLTLTMHLLERLQTLRAGAPVVPPLALDVTVDTGRE